MLFNPKHYAMAQNPFPVEVDGDCIIYETQEAFELIHSDYFEFQILKKETYKELNKKEVTEGCHIIVRKQPFPKNSLTAVSGTFCDYQKTGKTIEVFEK